MSDIKKGSCMGGKKSVGKSSRKKKLVPQICFVHIPRTAGTSLRGWLIGQKVVGSSWFWNGVENPHSKHMLDDLLKQRDPVNIQLIGGNIPLNIISNIPTTKKRVFLVVLRDPLSRVYSYYNFIKYTNLKHRFSESLQDTNLYEVLKGGGEFKRHLINEQLRYVFGLKRKIGLQSSVIIGKQESMDAFISLASKRIGFDNYELAKSNEGSGGYLERLSMEPNFGKAEVMLKELLADEIEFYNSFEDSLSLDAPKFNAIVKKFSPLF